MVELTWINQFLWLGSHCIGDPREPESLSETLLRTLRDDPPYNVNAVPFLALVSDDAILICCWLPVVIT